MKRFIAFWAGLAIVIAVVGFASNFTKTYNVPERKDYVKNEREAIAYISTDFNALIAHYNAMRTSVTYGTIDLPLTGWREVDASGDVGAIAANGGVLASDTTPILKSHTSGGTYKALTIQWAASNSDPISTQRALPADFNTSGDLVFTGRFGNDGNTDDIQPIISFYFNEHLAKVDVTGDAIDVTADTAYQTYTATVDASDITTDVDSVTIIITPAAHTTNTQLMSSAKLKYVRSF
jgi:hypothetical protein